MFLPVTYRPIYISVCVCVLPDMETRLMVVLMFVYTVGHLSEAQLLPTSPLTVRKTQH